MIPNAPAGQAAMGNAQRCLRSQSRQPPRLRAMHMQGCLRDCGLSDDRAEFQIMDRLSFIRFLGSGCGFRRSPAGHSNLKPATVPINIRPL